MLPNKGQAKPGRLSTRMRPLVQAPPIRRPRRELTDQRLHFQLRSSVRWIYSYKLPCKPYFQQPLFPTRRCALRRRWTSRLPQKFHQSRRKHTRVRRQSRPNAADMTHPASRTGFTFRSPFPNLSAERAFCSRNRENSVRTCVAIRGAQHIIQSKRRFRPKYATFFLFLFDFSPAGVAHAHVGVADRHSAWFGGDTRSPRMQIEHQEYDRSHGDCQPCSKMSVHRSLIRCRRTLGIRGARSASAAWRCSAIDHFCSTADLISFRSCRRAFLITPLKKSTMGIDINLATIPWGLDS